MRLLASTLFFLVPTAPSGCASETKEVRLEPARAFEHLKNQVALGPRIPGSEAHAKTRAYLLAELRSYGIEAQEIPFTANTPKGKVSMANVLAVLPGKRKESILLGSHFDTKDIGTPPCPGANDGASSTGLLLELARVLKANGPHPFTYRFAFFDGEEAVLDWSESDSLYGSRDLVARWTKEGTIASIKAMVLMDLVGDRDLGIIRESLSSGWLVQAIAESAKELGHGKFFFQSSESIEDDHRPFLQAGVPSINLIDVSYGPRTSTNGLGAYWHTAQDTIENCSPESLRIVGEVVLRALPKIEKRLMP